MLVALERNACDFLQLIKWKIQFAVAKYASEWCMIFIAVPVRGLLLIAARPLSLEALVESSEAVFSQPIQIPAPHLLAD